MAGLVERHRELAAVEIQRVGERVDVLEPDEPAENAYNKVSDADKTYTKKRTDQPEYALRVYESDQQLLEEMQAIGGTIDVEHPIIGARYDSPLEEGQRVRFPDGELYYLEAELPARTHQEFRSRMVDDNAPAQS